MWRAWEKQKCQTTKTTQNNTFKNGLHNAVVLAYQLRNKLHKIYPICMCFTDFV